MQFKVLRSEPHRALVELEGPLNLGTVPQVRKKLLKVCKEKSTRRVDIDCSRITSMDTAGIAMLVELLRALAHNGGELRLLHLSAAIECVIHLARLEHLFGIKLPSSSGA